MGKFGKGLEAKVSGLFRFVGGDCSREVRKGRKGGLVIGYWRLGIGYWGEDCSRQGRKGWKGIQGGDEL